MGTDRAVVGSSGPEDDETGANDGAGETQARNRAIREVVTIVASVLVLGVSVVAISGVWPPLMAIESGSMEPHIDTGDMVYVVAEDRFPGPGARHGVVTAAAAEESGYDRFGQPGDVILYEPNGNDDRTPIIHRAMFYVESGENWYDRTDPDAVGGAESCVELTHCPAPHDGFVTRGDANGKYDQVRPTESTVVRPRWVIGTAEARVPELGWLRL
ncbi:S26 family signal peptidase [Haloarcula sp. S1CR25-12]|uniref:S26 family signal peptidase n=1 Tax=Haloarcula saliterrae TaxID=2950534 RepID=A0ABU2FE52_9EURY|nr:S26 family signal peptidase [Haloarcula sp. S1CR25-12]MDS0260223.1 S26 family signal peptidase [Haloarcula sp. S1CR25-12]